MFEMKNHGPCAQSPTEIFFFWTKRVPSRIRGTRRPRVFHFFFSVRTENQYGNISAARSPSFIKEETITLIEFGPLTRTWLFGPRHYIRLVLIRKTVLTYRLDLPVPTKTLRRARYPVSHPPAKVPNHGGRGHLTVLASTSQRDGGVPTPSSVVLV